MICRRCHQFVAGSTFELVSNRFAKTRTASGTHLLRWGHLRKTTAGTNTSNLVHEERTMRSRWVGRIVSDHEIGSNLGGDFIVPAPKETPLIPSSLKRPFIGALH